MSLKILNNQWNNMFCTSSFYQLTLKLSSFSLFIHFKLGNFIQEVFNKYLFLKREVMEWVQKEQRSGIPIGWSYIGDGQNSEKDCTSISFKP